MPIIHRDTDDPARPLATTSAPATAPGPPPAPSISDTPLLHAVDSTPHRTATYTGRLPVESLVSRINHLDLGQRLHSKIIADLRDTADLTDPLALRVEIERLFAHYMAEEDVVLSRAERGKLFEQVYAEVLGYGPIQELVSDDTVSEIMVNGPFQVWVERQGKLILTDIAFKDEEHVMRVINRIVSRVGRRIDESSPMVDARLPDGSRVHAIIPPVSLAGPALAIRKFSRVPLNTEDMIRLGTLSPQAVVFLEAAVRAGLNIIVAGGTSSGKTTLLNVLSSFIPGEERIITIEDAAELQLQQVHVLPLESRPASIDGLNEITIRQLVISCLRMRPDRIIVGECRGKEALDMLQAMNTGHDGCMTTIHSNSPRDALSRIETMTIMAGTELSLRAIREQVSSAFDLIVYMERMDDGSRKVTYITEVQGFEEDMILLQDIFRLERVVEDGQVRQELVPTGIRPQVIRKIERARIFLSPDFFYHPIGARS